MIRGKIILIIYLIPLALAIPGQPLPAGEGHEHAGHQATAGQDVAAERAPSFAAMPAPGRKVRLESGGYLIYGFDKKPKMGTLIMKLEVFTPEGKRDTTLAVLADCGMPSMRGAHETGDQPFKLSRKGEYLLPVNIVMPGDWEIRLTIKKEGKIIFRGSHKFDV